MDLWIRSQKGRLTKISDIMQPIEDKFDNIRGWVLYAVKQSDAMFPLGIYKSKERALEVLDEIESFIENNYLSIDDIPSHDNVPFPGYYQTYFTTKTRKKVFQMPKE